VLYFQSSNEGIGKEREETDGHAKLYGGEGGIQASVVEREVRGW
ncbi:MAG: hypothetical protein QOF56_3556, partial [Acidobacteriaceae bacterium]|nr:hypothetical protein [Acidobacteriaceae bacterium]